MKLKNSKNNFNLSEVIDGMKKVKQLDSILLNGTQIAMIVPGAEPEM